MPYKCCVVGCKGNYQNGPKVRVFRFPKSEERRLKWQNAIHRDNFIPSDSSRVCEYHFTEQDFIWQSTQQDTKTGEIVSVKLNLPILKEHSIPSKFPNCPKYLSKTFTHRKSREEKLKELEEIQFHKGIEESKRESLIHKELTSFESFEGFNNLFETFSLKEGWFNINKDTSKILFKIEDTPGPLITWAVKISSNLEISTYLYGHPVSVQVFKQKTPFLFSSLDELRNLLDIIDSSVNVLPLDSEQDSNSENTGNTDEDPKYNDNTNNTKDTSKINNILNFVSNLLKNLKVDDDILSQGLQFISEQINLRTLPKERYRYSTTTMVFCSIVYTISPHAYKYLRNHWPIILPHPETIKGV